jgi:hypothetical protein
LFVFVYCHHIPATGKAMHFSRTGKDIEAADGRVNNNQCGISSLDRIGLVAALLNLLYQKFIYDLKTGYTLAI